MKNLLALSVLTLLANSAHASRLVDLKHEAIQAANFVAQCPQKFEGKSIVSAVKGTFQEGIAINFKTNTGEVVQIAWEKSSRSFKCDR